MDKYVKILKDNDLKVTSPRLSIMKFLDDHRTHPTAEKIFNDLKAKNPSLSRTTVYNTLELLREYRIIQVLSISESEMRFDFNARMHHHFLCKECGEIVDIDIECPHLDEMLEGDYKIEEIHGYFKGQCKPCIKRSKKNKKG